MKCSKCGTENPNEAIFCRHCGKRLKSKQRKVIGLGLMFSIIAFSIIALLIIYFFVANKPSENPSHIDTSLTTEPELESEISQSISTKENQLDWSGIYSASTYAGSTFGGTGITYTIKITLTRSSPEASDYFGNIVIDGYQTYEHGTVHATSIGSHLKIWYSQTDENSMGGFENGVALVEFIYNKSSNLMECQWFLALTEVELVNDETKFTCSNKFYNN